MMGTKDIEEVVIGAVRDSGLIPPDSVFVSGDCPEGKVTEERAVITVKEAARGPVFNRGFVEVSLRVPDKGGRADHVRLQELESAAVERFMDDAVGEHGGTVYRYGLHSHSIHADADLGCRSVDIRLLFETLNVR